MVTKAKNPPVALVDHGQSGWYDHIRRTLITSVELQRLIDEDGLRGITSNPTIFEKALLVQRGRRALRVHLADPQSGLERLRHVIEQALQPRR
jgi:transaldolase